ncbi:22835_t:CDS:2 [Racocetra persica]|uniref:22835_t:CDS:1 n=1 Tax=Racocetra persica TaxID=160502 RepID=A0ACA9NLW2_9GLOM|nr:22835_t:CDS:2 [Racocetra persica]
MRDSSVDVVLGSPWIAAPNNVLKDKRGFGTFLENIVIKLNSSCLRDMTKAKEFVLVVEMKMEVKTYNNVVLIVFTIEVQKKKNGGEKDKTMDNSKGEIGNKRVVKKMNIDETNQTDMVERNEQTIKELKIPVLNNKPAERTVPSMECSVKSLKRDVKRGIDRVQHMNVRPSVMKKL